MKDNYDFTQSGGSKEQAKKKDVSAKDRSGNKA